MHVIDLLAPQSVHADLHIPSKKRLLEYLAGAIAGNLDDVSERTVFESLCGREKLGSTGVGEGVAIPHGRLKQAGTVSCAFARLSEPIDFDAIDYAPVDLIFALVVPEECNDKHLRLLAEIAEMFDNAEFRKQLRTAPDSAALFDLLTSWQNSGPSSHTATG